MRRVLAAAVFAAILAAATAMALASAPTVQGTVQSVDPAAQTLTLAGGTTFAVPATVSTESLQPGDEVTVAYHQGKDGQKVVTTFWINSLYQYQVSD